MLFISGSDFELIVRQQPERARVAGGKEKERKPVDPPPIIQLKIRDQTSELARHYLQNPYYFMCCSLHDAIEDEPVPVPSSAPLAGTLVSSLHRLKDLNNEDGGFFVFGDLSIKVEGEYRLEFTLYEQQRENVAALKSIVSDRFQVLTPKAFPGMAESTPMSRSFADQGVKLRIRKEARSSAKRGSHRHEEYQATNTIPRSPDRSSISQIPNPAFGTYAPTSRDYNPYYTPQPTGKRQRTSADLESRGIYDNDARYSHPYHQTAMYPSQSGSAYPNPMMSAYSSGQPHLHDYGVRQPPTIANATHAYASPEDPMGAGYIHQQRYAAYNGTQMSPYGLPPTAQISPMPDAQRGQQTNLQPLVTGPNVNHQTTV